MNKLEVEQLLKGIVGRLDILASWLASPELQRTWDKAIYLCRVAVEEEFAKAFRRRLEPAVVHNDRTHDWRELGNVTTREYLGDDGGRNDTEDE